MRFELTEALIDEILFCMEDQDGEFFLDSHEGTIVNSGSDEFDADEEDRYLSLPEWEPSNGFRLMERFTASLHNPVVREELSVALDRGRGVFRAFKDTVSQYPEIEKRWFSFKDREMKREVIRWYNALRESWGLELIGEEPEDIEGLALEDFRFREGSVADSEAAEKLHRVCLEEYNGEESGGKESGGKYKMTAEILTEMSKWIFPGDLSVVVESAEGEFAAYISAAYTAPGRLHICALEVQPEYRGLGLGEALLSRLLEQADHEKVSCISIDLPAASENFSRVLAREAFQPSVQRYCR
ncbi:MAG: GNAT family N-acetyltransferase [Treponema sp.]|jgi:ribosomal protein S18 acetylase RimI-like enzyme|nr:GNAT family N-acetyltransferase [Treponema sp.]